MKKINLKQIFNDLNSVNIQVPMMILGSKILKKLSEASYLILKFVKDLIAIKH